MTIKSKILLPVPRVPDSVIKEVVRKLCENCKGQIKDKCPDCPY